MGAAKYFVDKHQGFCQYKDGAKFKGQLYKGKPQGGGIMLYEDGSRYEGFFVDGNAEG